MKKIDLQVQYAETVLFREKFCNWGSIPIQMQQVPVGLNTAQTQVQKPIDVLQLHKPFQRPNSAIMIDDGNSGKVKVWRVDDFKKVEIPPEKYGEFYAGESYIVKKKKFFRYINLNFITFFFLDSLYLYLEKQRLLFNLFLARKEDTNSRKGIFGITYNSIR